MPGLSARPKTIVDPHGFGIADPTDGTVVGRDGPRGRERVVSAVRLNDGPRLLDPARVLVDPWGFRLADPTDGSILGKPALWVQRMLSAGHAAATRRL
jgi:hypothetical protein